MPNPDAVAALLRGAKKWAVFVQQNPDAELDFSDADLRELQSFEGIQFTKFANFRKAKFSSLILTNSVCPTGADFSGATITGYTAIQLGDSDPKLLFERVTFEGEVLLTSGRQDIDLINCEAKGKVTLDGVFHAKITISGNDSKFRSGLSLNDAHFAGGLAVSGAQLRGDGKVPSVLAMDLRRCRFDCPVSVRNVRIDGLARFDHAIFGDWTDFRETVFRIAPSFHKAKLHEETHFNLVEHFAQQFPDTKSASAEDRYRTLKQLMVGRDALSEQLAFGRLEMKAAGAKRPIFNLHNIYSLAADHGFSWILPLLWLVAVDLGFFIAFGLLAERPPAELRPLLSLSLANSFPFVGVFKGAGLEHAMRAFRPDVQLWVQVLSILQSAVATILIFLAALGVRNRLRIK
jgi:uncharacterized protein YjbI with pentapeptide repeats